VTDPTGLPEAAWKKSSYSGNSGGDCVEVASGAPDVVPVRDSKDRSGPVLMFSVDAWSAFLVGVTSGEFLVL
jgi:hypothetical protein